MRQPLVLLLGLSLGLCIVSQAWAADWYTEFESRYDNPHSGLYHRSKGAPGWSEAYTLRAYLAMYRAKKDTKWLDYMVVRIDNLIGEMRDVPDWCEECWSGYKDGFKGWGTVRYTEQYDEFMVHDGHTCVPMARFVKLVYSDAALHQNYKPKADHYLSALENHIIAKWHANWNANRGTDGSLREWGGFKHLPHNQYLAFGTLLLVLHEIAQSPHYTPSNPAFPDFYLQEATEMAQFFKDDLRYLQEEDAYLWDYMKDGRREDTGHANLDIEFAIRAYHLGIVFDQQDMRRFASTFINVLWNQDEAKPEFRSHVDSQYGSEVGKYHLLRWLWLYEFDPRIGQLISRHYVVHPDKPTFGEMLANLACWQAGVLQDDYPPPQDEPTKSDTRAIRVAYIVHTAEGEGGVPCRACIAGYLSAVEGTEIVSTGIKFGDVRNELTRDRYDVFYFPGGGKSTMHAEALGKEGQDRIREFVRSGGGFLGICAGAHVGSHGPYGYCLGLANVKITATCTGDGDIEIRMEDEASKVFTLPEYLPATVRKIRHANGPLWEINDPSKPMYVVATFTGENGTLDFRPEHVCAKPGSFFADHPCIVYDLYGKGRVVLCSSHPEIADEANGTAGMIPEIIRWLAGRNTRPENAYLQLEKVSQLPSYCGLACMEMVFRYWGYPEHTQPTIAQRLHRRRSC